MARSCPLSSGRGWQRGVGREAVRVSEGPGKGRKACLQGPVEQLPWNLLGTGGGGKSPDLMMET